MKTTIVHGVYTFINILSMGKAKIIVRDDLLLYKLLFKIVICFTGVHTNTFFMLTKTMFFNFKFFASKKVVA